MNEKSSIECELIFDKGLHRVNFNGSLQELGYMAVLIINSLRSEYMAAGTNKGFACRRHREVLGRS